jgi:hypothetical protein
MRPSLVDDLLAKIPAVVSDEREAGTTLALRGNLVGIGL